MPTLPCPTCQKPVVWSPEAKWRPFCSERCRLIDLGAWMTERHVIPGEEANEAPTDRDEPRAPGDDDADARRRH